MSKPESDTNRWSGKSTEDVLAESFHELRDPIYVINGYLNVLKSAEVSLEQAQYILDSTLRYAIYAKDILDSVYQYMSEKRGGG